ncbi:MAG: crossover junction endodeoxyribonuclease RuvC [Syntrophothermus sp.]
MIILGIDPGTITTGYGIINSDNNKLSIVNSGFINLKKEAFLPEKLKIIYNQIDSLIKFYRPDEFSIETAFYGKNVQSAMKIGYARGVSILAAVQNNIPVSEYSPREVKKSVTGKGAAQKDQVAYMIKSILSLDAKMKLDESDAIAVALCHAFRCRGIDSPTKKTNWKAFVEANPERVIG